MNLAIIAGNLGMDPELRTGQSGGSVLKLRVATKDRFKDKDGAWQETTDWHSVVVFGNRATALGGILGKGDFVIVRGKMRTSSYEKNGEKRYSTEVIADDVELTGKRSDGGGNERRDEQPRRQDRRDDFGPPPNDDDIPF